MKARNVQCYLLLGSRVFCQALRTSIGPLVPAMAVDLQGFDMSSKAQLLGAFSIGYMVTQIPGGEIADRLGGKPVIFLGILLSALSALAAPTMSGMGMSHLSCCFVVMGAAQGPLFPVFSVMLNRWVPQSERSWASAITDSGSSMGQFLSILLAPMCAAHFGWRAVYIGFGALASGFAVLWQIFAASDPSSCWYITDEEANELRDAGVGIGSLSESKKNNKQGSQRGSLRVLLLHPAVLAIFVCHFVHNSSIYFLNSWMPTYFTDVLGVDAASVGLFLTVPEVAAFLMRFNSGFIAAGASSRFKLSPLGARRFFTAVSFLGQLFAIVFFATSHTSYIASFWLTVLLASSAFSAVGWRANYLDVTLHFNGVLSGLGNTIATVPGFAGPALTAWVLDSYDSWQPLFAGMAIMNVASLMMFQTMSVAEPLDKKE